MPDVHLEDGEEVLWDNLGNHFLGMASRGGHVLVTSRRLGFRPHWLNVQRDPWSLPLDDIDALDVSGARFLLVRHEGVEDWLVVPSPKSLRDGLEAVRPLGEAERVAYARDQASN